MTARPEDRAEPRLKIAVVLERDGCAEWVALALADMVASGAAEIVALSREACPPGSPAPLMAYAAADAAKVAEAPDPLAPVTPGALAARLPALAALPTSPGGEVDVVLDFGHGDGPFPKVRCGVWSFRFGGDRPVAEGEGFFREVAKGATSCPLLLVADHLPGGRPLVISRSQCHVNDMSLWRTRAPAAWKARALVRRALAALVRLGRDAFLADVRDRFDQKLPAPAARTSAFGMAAFKARLLARRLVTPYRLVREQWRIAVRVRPKGDPAADAPWGSRAWARGFRFIEAPFDRFFADPFLFERNGETVLFFEDWDWAAGKAVISCAKVADDGTLGPVEVVLDTPYHLSNPLVFEDDGTLYMIPETLARRRVEVYRAVEFPTRWELHCVPLCDLDIADACVVKDAGGWWMFAAVLDFGGLGWDELHVFRAEALCGPWRPVAGNPVVSDVRAARPGGRMWWRDGRLFRLSQDCSGRYGSGLGLYVAEPSEARPFAQHKVAEVNSFDFGMNGVHAYDATDRFEVVDGRHYQIAVGRLRAYWPLPRWLGRH